MTAELVLIKLGGSLVTDKRDREVVRADVLARLAEELLEVRQAGGPQVLLAHGSGSFGHAAAAGTPLGRRDRRERGELEPLRRAAARTQDAAARLHRWVIAALLEAGLPAFSLVASSFVWRQGGAVVCGALEPLLGALDLGLLPVGYGDVVMDRETGAAICSTEDLLLLLVMRLAAAGRPVREVLWLGATDGVLDTAGRRLPRISEAEIAAARDASGGSEAVDVTGGMRLRVDTAWSLARRGVPSWIVDGRRPGALRDALGGAAEGTRVVSLESATRGATVRG